MANLIRAILEIGPKGKKVVVVTPDWPGFERGTKTADAAIEGLFSYVPRNATVTKLAGMKTKFSTITGVDVVEQYAGISSDL